MSLFLSMNARAKRRPPYFDWRLDRWKIGLALLLWLGLLLFPPAQPMRPAPQGASPIARPGQRPIVGGSTQSEPLAAAPQTTQLAALPTAAARAESATNPTATAALTLAILEPGPGLLHNSTPLFYGESAADGLVEIVLEGRRYASLADGDGYWQFAPAAPLPVGMTWVQARQVAADGSALSSTLSQMALIGPDATPVAAPEIVTPLSAASALENSTPLISGVGPPGMVLLLYAQNGAEGEARVVGEVTVNGEGTWLWQASTPLAAGTTRLWAVAVNSAGRPLSRSWPLTTVNASH